MDAILARAEAEGKFARKFATKGASHTSQMDPLLGELTAELQGIKPTSPTCGIFSTVHEGRYIKPGGEPIHDVEYWKKGCGIPSTSPTASATPSTAGTPPSWSWHPIRWR